MIDVVELVWPRLKGGKSDDEVKADRRRDCQDLRSADWSHDVDVVLEEARRLQDAELDRRKSVEGKAVAYLTLVGVLIPLITTFGANAWDSKLSAAQRFTGLVPLLAAIVYLLAAGRWAFHALDIQASARVDGQSLARLWSRPRNAPAALVNEILVCVRFDQDGVNAKASAIRMTHAFLRRAAVTFTLLLTIQIAWKPTTEIIKAISIAAQPKLPHPVPKKEKVKAVPPSPKSPRSAEPQLPSRPEVDGLKSSKVPPAGSEKGRQPGSPEKSSTENPKASR